KVEPPSSTDGKVKYTPDATASGQDSFEFQVTDSHGAKSKPVAITVVIDLLPNATAGKANATSGTPVNIQLNGTDPDTGDKVSTFTVTKQPTKGKVEPASSTDGKVKFTPNADASGQDSFEIQVTDSHGAKSEPALVKINIGLANKPPLAKAGELGATAGSAVAIKLNGTDPDTGDKISTFTVTKQPTKGKVDPVSSTDGKVKYTPNADASGQDSFEIQVTDSQGAKSEPALVKINIGLANKPPLAKAGELGATAGSAVAIKLNGTDPDTGDKISTFTVTKQPTKGKVDPVSSTDGKVKYTPNADASGQDSFEIQVTDSHGAKSEPALVKINIGLANKPPLAKAGELGATAGSAVAIKLNGTDPDTGDKISTFTVTKQPTKGKVDPVSSTDGKVKYTPNADASGQDSFEIQVTDSHGAKSEPALVKINIGLANKPPLAKAGELGATAGSAVAIKLNGTDPDTGDKISTFTVTKQPTKGKVDPVSSTDGKVKYTPNADAS